MASGANNANVREIRKRRGKLSTSAQAKVSKVEHPSVHMTEEEEAISRNCENDVTLFKETVSETKRLFKECLSQKLQSSGGSVKDGIAENSIQVGLLYLTLKKLNRLDKFRCQKANDMIHDAMQKVDSIHLQLQNLHYEAVHLKKEITKCLEFKSLDEEVNLISVGEFYKTAPNKISRSSETKKDAHQLTLARLQWELEQRKELAKKLSLSKKNQEEVRAEILKKQSNLDNLRPTLKSILKAAEPLQNEIGVPLLASHSFHKMAEHLPQPLFILFIQSSAYQESSDKQLVISVEGNMEEATAWKETDKNLDEESDSDQEDNERKKRHRHNTMNKTEIKRNKLLQKHPLNVKMIVKISDDFTATLNFFYLVSLRIVTVETSVLSPLSSFSSSNQECISSPAVLLNCLYSDDTGDDTPNPANHYQLNKLGMDKFTKYISEIGRPYMWSQHLCGLTFKKMFDGLHSESGCSTRSREAAHSVSSSYMEQTIKAIRSRLLSRYHLQQQLEALEKGIIPIAKQCSSLFPNKIMCRLSSWKPITWTEFNVHQLSNVLKECGVADETDFFFNATIERSSAKLLATIVISPQHPNIPPYFILDVNWQGTHSSTTDVHIRDMEKEVNVYWHELTPNDKRDQILVNQLERLKMCFDIYLETGALERDGISEGPCEFQKEKIFFQASRGKDHRRPYKYSPQLGVFVHR